MPATVSTTSAPAAGVAGGDSTFTGDQHAIPVASVDEVERYEAVTNHYQFQFTQLFCEVPVSIFSV